MTHNLHPRHTVWVVDDDRRVAMFVARVLEASGEFACRVFTCSRAFLSEVAPKAAECVVSDVKMPEVDGIQLQQQLLEVDPTISVLFLTGYADVPTTVQVMEQGAVTLLQKPCEPNKLVSAVRRAVSRCRQLRQSQAETLDAQARLGQLTDDQREVLECMLAGLTNKAIAVKLSLSPRTLDRRRQSILQTMGVASVVELAALLERTRLR